MKQALVGVFVPCIIFKVDVNALCGLRVSETNHPFKVCEAGFLKLWLKACLLEACISLKIVIAEPWQLLWY